MGLHTQSSGTTPAWTMGAQGNLSAGLGSDEPGRSDWRCRSTFNSSQREGPPAVVLVEARLQRART
jgi:hypothetical protein